MREYYKCENCGCTDLEVNLVMNPNTKEIIPIDGTDNGYYGFYCDMCDTPVDVEYVRTEEVTLESVMAMTRKGTMLNPKEKVVNAIIKRLNITDDYCPCVAEQNEDTKCPCLKYRTSGYCCCNLYVSSND